MPHPGVAPWLIWLQNSVVGLAIRRSLWLYPGAEITHIVGIVLLVGAALMFDLRLLGLTRRLSVAEAARHLLPWSWRGLALVVISGLAMFAAHAPDWAYSMVFRLKLGLILTAGLNVLIFHRGVFRSVARWDRETRPPAAARAAAALSIFLWIAVIACGRLLAYIE